MQLDSRRWDRLRIKRRKFYGAFLTNKKVLSNSNKTTIRKPTLFSRNQATAYMLPPKFGIVLLKNDTNNCIILYFYSECASFYFCLHARDLLFVRYYADVNCIRFMFKNRTLFTKPAEAHMRRIVYIFYATFIKRLRVRGRLYRVYKRNKYRDLIYRFGNAHKVTLPITGLNARYIRKKRIRVRGFDYELLNRTVLTAYHIYALRQYTKRGIRIGGRPTKTRLGKLVKFY